MIQKVVDWDKFEQERRDEELQGENDSLKSKIRLYVMKWNW